MHIACVLYLYCCPVHAFLIWVQSCGQASGFLQLMLTEMHSEICLKVYCDACYRASLGWFAFEPEWYDTSYVNFTQSEAQSVSAYVHYLSNERADSAVHSDLKGRGHENGNSLADAVRRVRFKLL